MSMNQVPVDRRQEVHITQQPGIERREVLTEDVDANKRQTVGRIANLIGFLFLVLEGLIGLRVLLKLLEANPQNAFARALYNFTTVFLAPFSNLTINPRLDGITFEITSIIAMIVYAMVAWAVIRLAWLIFYQPSARSVSTYEHEDTPRAN